MRPWSSWPVLRPNGDTVMLAPSGYPGPYPVGLYRGNRFLRPVDRHVAPPEGFSGRGGAEGLKVNHNGPAGDVGGESKPRPPTPDPRISTKKKDDGRFCRTVPL